MLAMGRPSSSLLLLDADETDNKVLASMRPYQFYAVSSHAFPAATAAAATAATSSISSSSKCLLMVWVHPFQGPRFWGLPLRFDWTPRWRARQLELQRQCSYKSITLWAPLFYRARLPQGRYTGSRAYAAFLAARLSDMLDDLLGDRRQLMQSDCSSYDLLVEAVGDGGLAVRTLLAASRVLWPAAEAAAFDSVVAPLQQRLQQLHTQGKVILRNALFDNTPHAGLGGPPLSERPAAPGAPLLQRLLLSLPSFVMDKALRLGDKPELYHADSERMLCRLAQAEKQDLVPTKGGTLLSLFETVLVYGHLNEPRVVPPNSALALSYASLGGSRAYQLLEREPFLHNRFYFVDALQTPLNRLAWGPDGAPRQQTLPFYFRRLLHDKDVCLREPPKTLAALTLELLEAVNPNQQPRPVILFRYAAFTDKDFYRGPRHRWGALLPGGEETNEGSAWLAVSHQSVRSLQGPQEQKQELAGDRIEQVVSQWWQW